MTVFLYTFTERETLYNFFEFLTGARFTTSYARIGGQIRDLPEGFTSQLLKFCDEFIISLDEVDTLLTRNKIFLDRTRDMLRRADGHRGHIFNLGHGVMPETDPDVLARVVDLVHAEGRVR